MGRARAALRGSVRREHRARETQSARQRRPRSRRCLYYPLLGSVDSLGLQPYADGRIIRYDRRTGATQVLAEHQDRPIAVAVDDHYVDWFTKAGQIFRVAK